MFGGGAQWLMLRRGDGMCDGLTCWRTLALPFNPERCVNEWIYLP